MLHLTQAAPDYTVWIIAGISIVALWIILYFVPLGLWFSAMVSGVRISLLQLVLMRWRKVTPSTIVSAMIEGTKAGLTLNPNELEAHYLAGGHVANVVHALVSAQKANITLDFRMATAIDLAGHDVFQAVQMSVNPKVINTPPVMAVAKDGIQLICKARVTVRASIKQLVGGAGEETILARVGEGIVSSIGSSESHKTMLENPDFISRVVLNKGLDAGTAFEILSIDIAVGRNIGAVLQMDQANADKNIAQTKAEEKRAMAVAEAFRSGNIGIMDYYKLQNIQADTKMCDSIGVPSGKSKTATPHPKDEEVIMGRSTLKTKIKRHNNLKERIRVWRIGDFMRQFAIVTAGVMVTFIGSYLINSHSTDNQIESSLQLIIKELENNKKAIKDIQVKHEMDRTISQYLVDSSFRVDNFHIDTLDKYKRLISQISGFTYSSDALEVLKTSSLMQSIEDKNLLLRIIETYKNLGQIKEGMVEYYDLKKSVIIPIVLGSDTSTDSGDLRQTYKYMLSQKSIIAFCRVATSFVDAGYFNARVADVDSTLNLLRSQYN